MRRRSAAGVRLVSSADPHRPLRRAACPPTRTTSPSSSDRMRELVLLGEHLGRRHERALVAALHRGEQRGERDDRLARADLALQQPVHRRRAPRGRGDLGDRARLVAGEREREPAWKRGHERRRRRRAGSRSRRRPSARLRATSASCMRRNSSNFSRCAGGVRVGHGLGPVDVPVGARRGRRGRAPRGSASSSGSAKPALSCAASADATARRSCHVCTSAFPDCGYTGTMVPVDVGRRAVVGSASTSTTGLVIWRLPR